MGVELLHDQNRLRRRVVVQDEVDVGALRQEQHGPKQSAACAPSAVGTISGAINCTAGVKENRFLHRGVAQVAPAALIGVANLRSSAVLGVVVDDCHSAFTRGVRAMTLLEVAAERWVQIATSRLGYGAGVESYLSASSARISSLVLPSARPFPSSMKNPSRPAGMVTNRALDPG